MTDSCEIALPNKGLAVFDSCPRGFEAKLEQLMEAYAREAIIADRVARGAVDGGCSAVAATPRRLFTIIAAHPVEVESHELPRVRVDIFLCEGADLKAAFQSIAAYTGIVDATEVFGFECTEVRLTPTCQMQRQESLEQWKRWSSLARAGEMEGWELLAEGAESFDKRQDRIFAERYPRLA